jgi:hypothetical protein
MGSNRGVVELGSALGLTPMAHAGVLNRRNFVIHFIRKEGVALVAGLTGSLSSSCLSLRLASRACGSHIVSTVRRVLLGEPPSREHGKGGSLYLEDKVSIAIPSQLV